MKNDNPPPSGPQYKKLPGRVASLLVGVNRLWYTDDHVIAVTAAYGFENYKRAYFRDIDAFIVRRTKARMIWNIVFGVVLAGAVGLGSLIATFTQGDSSVEQGFRIGMLAVLGIPAVIALIALIVNTAKGATCTFWVQTSGGVIQMGAPGRVPTARKVTNILAPLVVEAQNRTRQKPENVPIAS